MQGCFSDICLKPSFPPAIFPNWQYMLYLHFMYSHCVCPPLSSSLSHLFPDSTAALNVGYFITSHSSLFSSWCLLSCVHLSFSSLFSFPLRASCVSLINLYHSLVNCLTFTSCVWGACSGKRNGSAVLQGQIHPLVSSPSFFSCHPFISLPFTCSAGVESPS